MSDVRPFCALRPRDDLASAVIAPPYDVLSEAEARAIARERRSFIRITRSEVDLPEGSDAHSESAYRKARENLDAFIDGGILVEDERPRYYLYGQTMGSHSQVGFLAACSVKEYDEGLIVKHEHTRPDKEDDRTHHMDLLDAQVGLVFLAYASSAAGASSLAEIRDRIAASEPAWAVTTDDGVIHRLWLAPESDNAAITAAFAALPRTYIADGHHRSAAASRLHAARKDPSSAYFLAGLFSSDSLQILSYNRVVHDLNGLSEPEFLARLGRVCEIYEGGPDTPRARGEIAMRLPGRWYRLALRPELRKGDPVADLDVSLLQDHVLAPILGVDDPRRSERIRFVGGIRGPGELARAVDGGDAVAFHLYPTSLAELFSVADAGKVMPPKSTWFEPKLREGVAVRRLT